MTMLSVFTLIDLSHIKTAVSANCQSHFLYHSARRFDTGKQATEISIAEQDKKKFRFFFFIKWINVCVCVCVQPFQPLKQLIDFHGLRNCDMPLKTQQSHTNEFTTASNWITWRTDETLRSKSYTSAANFRLSKCCTVRGFKTQNILTIHPNYTKHAIKCYHSRRHGLRPSLLGYKNYITFYILLTYIILTNNK